MGALFALFNTNELKNFELNWKDIEKSHPADASLYSECLKMIQKCKEIELSIDNYQGAKVEIQLAMSSSSAQNLNNEQKELLRNALIKVIPNAALCQSWMQFAQKLSKFLVKKLLPRLSAPIIDNAEDSETDDSGGGGGAVNGNDNDDNIDVVDEDDDEEKKEMESVSELTILTHQALVRCFAMILDFLLTFDQKKMMKPEIQNDFSFYKRTLSKQNEEYLSDLEWIVSNEKAGFVSMFLAEKVVTMKEVAAQLALSPQSLKVLAIFCNACLDLLKENKFGKDAESQKLALRAMTSAFVIYDHGNTPYGAFQRHKKSDTKAQKIIQMIATDYESLYGNKQHCDGLANIIKYATATYKDNKTPASIKNALQ